ncbi:MAG: biotin-dependent carboxyltransferase family protein [Bacteroidota bacterium]
MPQLEIIKPGLLTTIQDLGRSGSRFYAIPVSGAMDPNAAAIALLLLDAAPSAPLIECTSLAPTICFHGAGRIALSGGDFGWRLNERAVPRNQVLAVADGDVLRGGHATDQLRGYLAVGGELSGAGPVYGSYSTYLNGKFGGWQGRRLQKGDRLNWQDLAVSEDIFRIPLRQGPEFTWLMPESRKELFDAGFVIGPETNRMGARLQGPVLRCKPDALPDSVPVLPGFVQLPPGGQLIVVLQDGQVTGGYPRVAYLSATALLHFNRIPLGAEARFCPDDVVIG